MASRDLKKSEKDLAQELAQKKRRRPKPKVLEGTKWTYFGHSTGWCHFHIVTNQKRDGNLWVELMASCERETRFWIPWLDLAEPVKGWHMGWVKDLPETKKNAEKNQNPEKIKTQKKSKPRKNQK